MKIIEALIQCYENIARNYVTTSLDFEDISSKILGRYLLSFNISLKNSIVKVLQNIIVYVFTSEINETNIN